MGKSSQLCGAVWIPSILLRLPREGVRVARFLNQSGWAGRERISAGFRFAGRKTPLSEETASLWPEQGFFWHSSRTLLSCKPSGVDVTLSSADGAASSNETE